VALRKLRLLTGIDECDHDGPFSPTSALPSTWAGNSEYPPQPVDAMKPGNVRGSVFGGECAVAVDGRTYHPRGADTVTRRSLDIAFVFAPII
jgi:hypothetical protein